MSEFSMTEFSIATSTSRDERVPRSLTIPTILVHY